MPIFCYNSDMPEEEIKPPSRLSQIRKLLEEEGKPLSIQDMALCLGLPENKIRQSIGGSYELKVMRVTDKLYDLPERVYIGKNFRPLFCGKRLLTA